jgi:hypothetical protein
MAIKRCQIVEIFVKGNNGIILTSAEVPDSSIIPVVETILSNAFYNRIIFFQLLYNTE